jgi:hypothetical protein
MELQSKKLNFNGQNIYAGVDVHLKSWKGYRTIAHNS